MNAKKDNQYYGKYFEYLVACILNKELPCLSAEQWGVAGEDGLAIEKEAHEVAAFLGPHRCFHTGLHTGNADADLVLDDGQTIELKRVSSGSGTYYNTSIYHMMKYGFNFKDYLREFGLYDALKDNFSNLSISEKNNSPVSMADSSKIRHQFATIYTEKICPIDAAARGAFVQDLRKHFVENPNDFYGFVSDMLYKQSLTSHKKKPDRIIVYNYKKHTISEINLAEIITNLSTYSCQNTDADFSILAGPLRFVFSWQNGCGLNNPTIRTFLR